MREKLAGNILTEGATAGEIRIGPGGDYENLDDAAHDLRQGIPAYLRKDLVVLVGEELIGTRTGTFYKKWGNTPSEKSGVDQALSLMGGMPWETPSFIPDRAMVVTSYKNLSIYTSLVPGVVTSRTSLKKTVGKISTPATKATWSKSPALSQAWNSRTATSRCRTRLAMAGNSLPYFAQRGWPGCPLTHLLPLEE